MVEMKLNIQSSNDAFVDYPVGEMQRILRDIADRLSGLDGTSSDILDINGNIVGDVFFLSEDDD